MTRRIDFAIAAGVLAAGMILGGVYRRVYDEGHGPQDMPTREFGAAVSMACGRGFTNPGYDTTRALDDFLMARRDRLECSDLPAVMPKIDINATQRLYRYLMMTSALVWKVTGISWTGLRPLYALLYGVTLAVTYGIFRLGIRPVLALAATAGLALSPVHLQHLPFLRDYAKAPFILGLILIMGLLASGTWSSRRNLIYSVLFGIVLGVGFGFRNDLLIVIVPWLVVVAFGLPGSLRANVRVKAACLGLSAAAFLVSAWPILTGYAAGSSTGHVTVLGLMTPFDAPLGVAAPVYDTGYLYNDQYGWTVVQSYAFRQFGKAVLYMEKDYDRAAVAYILTIARHWPADLLARAYGSVLTVLDVPFNPGEHVGMIPVGVTGALALRFYYNVARVQHLLSGLGPMLVLTALAIVSIRHLRAAIVLLLLLFYFAGYPALQFHVRHYFHLEFIGMFALAFLIDRLAIAARDWRQVRLSFAGGAVRAAAFAAVALAVLVGTMAPLRAYQASHTRRLLSEDYLSAEREAVDTHVRAAAPGRVLIDTSGIWHEKPAGAPITTEYLVAQFSRQDCDAIQVPATFRYRAESAGYDFSRDVDVRLPAGGAPTIVMQPVFDVPSVSRFAGIELPSREAGCLQHVYRVRQDRLPPVLLDVNAPPSWQRGKLYETILAFERPSDGEDSLPRLYTHARTYALRPHAPLTPFAIAGDRVAYRNAIVSGLDGGAFRIAGRPDTPASMVLLLERQQLDAGAAVVVRGEVREGGIALGLARDGQAIDVIEVTQPGPFEAAVVAPAAGPYDVALANRVTSRWRQRNDVAVTAFGSMPGGAPETGSAPR